MNDTLQQITIGDWSDDGHDKKEHFIFVSNKTTEELQKGYLASCDTTGYTFDTNVNVNGNITPKARLLNAYEDCYLSPEVIDDLMTFGLPDPRGEPTFLEVISEEKMFDDEYDDGYGQIFFPEGCFHLVMWFISVSLPDLEYEMKTADVEQVNGYWGNLNQSFGYGCFQ
jgi:hypothetical protein